MELSTSKLEARIAANSLDSRTVSLLSVLTKARSDRQATTLAMKLAGQLHDPIQLFIFLQRSHLVFGQNQAVLCDLCR